MMTDPLRDIVLPRLDRIKKSGAGFMARCPAHDDGTASLSIATGKDHPVVFHCHAGCQPDDILGTLGLTWAELSAPRERQAEQGEWTPAGPAVAVYDYVDEQGKLLYQVLRTATKDFRQRVPDPTAKSGWMWRLGDTRRVPYQLPEVLAAVQDGKEIYICEGEKDVHTLAAAGIVATCNPGGAGKWRPEYSEHLREAIVTVVADKDAPGQAHARQVATSLKDVAVSVRIVEAAAGKDATDHANAGHSLADLITVWDSEERAKPDLAPDLWEFISVADEPYDWIVPGVLERGDRLILTGFEGLGKSMLQRQMAVCIAAGIHPFTLKPIEPHKVLLIDCENSERQSRRKFRPLAAASISHQRRVPEGGLRIIHRSEGIDLTRADDAAWLLERVTAHQPDVLFIGPFYRLHNANINEEMPARKTVAALDLARTQVDCALIIEAHAGHGEAGKNRSVRPAGSSLLLRWPEFGFGLAPAEEPQPGQRCKEVVVKAWRGARDDREWPSRLVWGDPWPWRQIDDGPRPHQGFSGGLRDTYEDSEVPEDDDTGSQYDQWPAIPPPPSGRVETERQPANGQWLVTGRPVN
jgi:5S rRNA maturation endonuclease (ribonuclease M5)